jgi:L-asparaginase II
MHDYGIQDLTHEAQLDKGLQNEGNGTNLTSETPIRNGFANLQDENIVITDRAGIIENTHRIHAAIVDSNGTLLYKVGDPHRVTLLRSAVKPIQTLAIIETGAAQRFGYDDADVALMCASHNSEPRHISRAQAILDKTGFGQDSLACGGHPAVSPEINRRWIKEDFTPTSICSNCSGKHAGMIAAAVTLGATVHDYNKLHHPVQQYVKRATEDLSGLGEDEIQWGVDGCNAATPALPLYNFALMFARLAEARNGSAKGVSGQGSPKSCKRTEDLARIYKSMSTYPELVAGEGRFCTVLMEAYKGLLVGKVGADGCYGIALCAPPDGLLLEGAEQCAIGIAVKVEDGNLDILYSAVPEILQQLNIGTEEMRNKLASFHHPPILNTAKVLTGGISHMFKMQKVDENGKL